MKKIAIIGASYLQLPLVQKANEIGLETYCFAYEEGAVCKDYCHQFFPISILEKDKILELCRKIKIDGIISIASDLAVITVNYIANKLGLIANPWETTSITINKYEMKVALEAMNLKVPRYAVFTSLDELNQLNQYKLPVIVKPVDRSGSMGVSKVESLDAIHVAFESAMNASLSKQVIIEEFITGIEASVEGISQNGQHHVLAITDKITTGAPNFVELEHHQPSQLNIKLQESIKQLIPKALNALQIKYGASHTELIITVDNKIYINEIGARMGGDFIGSDLVKLSTGFDYLKAVLYISLGKEIELQFGEKKYAGVIFRNANNSIKFDSKQQNDSSIIKLESNLVEKQSLDKSSDRGNYLIYQSNHPFIL